MKKKSWINYKITTFLEPIREPRAARHPMSPNAQIDKTHQGETETHKPLHLWQNSGERGGCHKSRSEI